MSERGRFNSYSIEDKRATKAKKEYVPSHEREGFKESKVIKVPFGHTSKGMTLGQIQWRKRRGG